MRTGRYFLQGRGPTNAPLGVLAAIAMPTIDHRGLDFAALARNAICILGQLGHVLRTEPRALHAAE